MINISKYVPYISLIFGLISLGITITPIILWIIRYYTNDILYFGLPWMLYSITLFSSYFTLKQDKEDRMGIFGMISGVYCIIFYFIWYIILLE